MTPAAAIRSNKVEANNFGTSATRDPATTTATLHLKRELESQKSAAASENSTNTACRSVIRRRLLRRIKYDMSLGPEGSRIRKRAISP